MAIGMVTENTDLPRTAFASQNLNKSDVTEYNELRGT